MLVAWGPLSVLRRPLAIVIFGVLLLAGVAAMRAQVQRELAAAAGGRAPTRRRLRDACPRRRAADHGMMAARAAAGPRTSWP